MVVTATKTFSRTGQKLLGSAAEIAQYYGFVHAPEAFAKIRSEKTRGITGHHAAPLFPDDPTASLLSCILPEASGDGLLDNFLRQRGEPMMLYYWCSQRNKNTHGDKATYLRLEIFGLRQGLAEALLIRTAQAILSEAGFRDITLTINATGDRDSFARFLRECSTFYKKHADALHASCKIGFKASALAPLICAHDKCQPLKQAAPKPIAFLTEESRKHFKEVLEYLEEMETPYIINDVLMGTSGFPAKTIFEIFPAGAAAGAYPPTSGALARGERYDDLARRFIRRDIPAIGISIPFYRASAPSSRSTLSSRKPAVYFIQLGARARLKSFRVLELLRHARIPACQPFGNTTLSERLTAAEQRSIPYTLIMGQKEAMQDTIIVRETGMRTQETVSISHLTSYLKQAQRHKEMARY